jgi:hypothetical protein
MPFLLPPPEYKPGELSQLGLTGTCELQICRSSGPWSLGTPDKVECSIQNAYLKGMHTTPSINLDVLIPRSHSVIGTFCLYRKSILHHVVRRVSCSSFTGNSSHEKGQWWTTLLLKTRLATQSSIASSAHTARVQSGGAASLSPSFLGFRSPSATPTPAL